MQIFMVGGAVRDRLMGLPVRDRDWVVVGSTPDEMLSRGYRQVGKDFPVFLHPDSGEEYALARTERKTGPGYHGFDIHAAPDVTLEQDLERRDLTINAIAETPDGRVVDPYGGQADIENRVLRHISDAFSEDPVRILRVARFAARFASLGFTVADETRALMKKMVANGEVGALVAERVWAEMKTALSEPWPGIFIDVLRECGALAMLIPELDRLFGVPQPEKHHPEIDTGRHVMLALARAAALSDSPEVRFAVLMHDLGKGTTPETEWPRHIGHEVRSVDLILAVCTRMRLPNSFRDLAVLVARYHTHCHRAMELRATTLLDAVLAVDGLRRAERFESFLLACQADAQGRSGFEDSEYPQAQRFRQALEIVRSVDVALIAARGLTGQNLAKAVRQERVRVLRAELDIN